jgi:DNA-binding transcriptional LysR family regulator
MDLRHLRCFVAVAEELHFGRAARRLHLSQPPVSQALKELETELGLRLLERSSRRIALTPAGAELLRDARAVLARTESLKERARAAAQGQGGRLALGFISLATTTYLPRVLKRFTTELPQVQLQLLESTSDRILADLEAGTLDVGCLFAPPQLPAGLGWRTTAREPLVVALPADHPLATLQRVPLARLKDERFLAFERHHGPLVFDTVIAACMRQGFSPRLFPARQMHTILSLVSGGVGVALVPASMQALQREGVVLRPLRGERALVESGVAWRLDDEDAPPLQRLLAELAAQVPVPRG